MQDSRPRVVIIGGGLAGLAAASELAIRKIPALLLESRPRLGGRASSFLDPTTGSFVDNCQHVSMGCCTNFAHFLKTLGLTDCFRRERMLYFIGPNGMPDRFSASSWPCPFHLAGAFRRLSYLSLSDKWDIARGLRALAAARDPVLEDQTFSRWLADHRQPPGAIDGFWQVVLVSALSETLDRIAVPEARKVFVDGFLQHRDGWYVDIPIVPLEELYGARLIGWLAERGVEVRLQSGVERLNLADERIASVALRDGTKIAGEEFLLTVPFHRVPDLLPEELQAHSSVQALSQLESAPITSLHLWLDKKITDLPHAVLVGRLSQWLFNRTELCTTSSQSPPTATAGPLGWYYQIVISASRNLSGMSQEDVEQTVLAELAEVFPESREAQVLHYRVVTEHRAVFSVKPGAERLRPSQQSPVANLQWAGDWTRTGWPGTMEGAVRSGYLAVENVLERIGRQETILQPDLPAAFWSRWLLGIT